MKLPELTAGRFVRRDNRFLVTVKVEGEFVGAHLPNSGRLAELLIPGRSCWLAAFGGSRRKTRFDLKLVEYAGALVSVDARLPNPLIAEALEAGRLKPFRGYAAAEREVWLGDSRLDFRLSRGGDTCWVEVKSATLVQDGVARFPDAVTARGVRHLQELARAAGKHGKAGIVFVVQRPDADRFAPHDGADPIFGAALREAASAGVGVYAWTCEVSLRAIAIARQIPVDLG